MSSHEQGPRPRADERLALGIVFGAVGAAVLGSLFVALAPALPKRAPPQKADVSRTVREDIAADVDAAVAAAITSMARADGVVVEAEAVVARARATRDGKTATLPNGLVFRGEVLEGAPEGTGSLHGGNTAFGAGFFVGGVRSGPGADCQRADCSGPSYFGDYRADSPTGVARIVYEDGSIYRGDVRNGAPDGFGELRKPDGMFYRGAFAAGVREGYGVEATATGPVKAGFWKGNQLSEELRS
ncbi:MAG: hypothetical protein IV086_09605 [Hyphomonadaceae bacterium]|nr:MAG: MORN domain-containing protein [Caulobacteraceae bacterium]MBT9445939.1 hypothetical protein [Hyphomonadaceae bacterium]TPW04771.1 MAG: MORN domain-containing protein [Alphaproteobacteria bacterium]